MAEPLKIQMEIRAPGFPRDAHDDEMVNSFMSGHALALFVEKRMEAKGYVKDALIDEDWGWLLMMRDPDHDLAVEVCFHSLAAEDDDPAADHQFYVTFEPARPVLRRWFFLSRNISAAVRRLSDAVFSVLSESEGVIISKTEEIPFD